jgi:hypothetical protein
MSIPEKVPDFDQPAEEGKPKSNFQDSGVAGDSEPKTWEEMSKSRKALSKRMDSLLRAIGARRGSL